MSNLDDLAKKMVEAQTQAKPATAPEPVKTAPVTAPPQVNNVAGSTTTATAAPVVDASKLPFTNEQLLALIADVQKLKVAEASKDKKAVSAAVQSKPAIDWTKITEKDITNLDLEIPVIEQEKPSYMDVHLLDKMYVVRWIHKLPQRLGVCLAEGYQYIKKEDMDPRYPIPLAFDESGNYSCGDVVALKILKSRYYPALKANYIKTMAIHGKATLAKAVATGKSGVQLDRKGEEIIGGLSPEQIDPRGLDIYDPGATPAKGEREFTREMVQI